MKVKDEFLLLGKFELGDGSQVHFWEDAWITLRPLKLIFPALYNIVRRKGVSVRKVLSTIPLNVAFQRSLVDVNLQSWHEVVAMVADVQLTNQRDRFVLGATSEWIFFSKIHVPSLVRI
jgi:hypothetical protein